MERQRTIRRIARAQETGEDQHPLGMKWAAQLDLSLDVYHFALAQSNASRDAVRVTEGELP